MKLLKTFRKIMLNIKFNIYKNFKNKNLSVVDLNSQPKDYGMRLSSAALPVLLLYILMLKSIVKKALEADLCSIC